LDASRLGDASSLRAGDEGDLDRDLSLGGVLDRDLERSDLRGEREALRERRERLCLCSSSESLRGERDLGLLERERERE
jgi:hypothetical protein